MPVHPTAVIAPSAQIDPTTTIGPFCVIGANVRIGAGCHLISHVVLLGPTELGRDNRVYPFAVLGGAPQDLSYRDEPTRLEIGDKNEIREGVSIHRGTTKGAGVTQIGDETMIMASSHVAHDCKVGSRSVLTNGCTLGGHVELESHVVLGGHVAIAPFVRIGRGAFVAAAARVERNVPPYMIAAGDRARIRAPNRVGQRRLGIPMLSQTSLKRAYHLLWGRHGTSQALHEVERLLGHDPFVQELIAFLRSAATGED